MLVCSGVPAPTLKIFFHNHCFDGASSAALFADFYRSTQKADAAIEFRGMVHRVGDPFSAIDIDGDENACVDFRYCKDERMNWWFDHHASAFQPPTLVAHYEASRGLTKFYDPAARSCALFMARVMREEFGYEPDDSEGHWKELLTWADRIDGAVFQSAREIVELDSPVLRMMLWIRGCRDSACVVRLIGLLGHQGFDEIEKLPWVAGELAELLRQHRKTVDLIAEHLVFDGQVATYDLSEEELSSHSTFAAYMFCPNATYSIGLTKSSNTANISIGHNPWASPPATHNIAKLCERYGGGGHPRVGGIALPAGDMRRPREVVEELRLALHEP